MNSQPRKILFLAPSLSGGGAQRVLSTLLRHLDRDRFVLHLGLLQRSGPYLEDIPSDVVIHDLKVSRVRFALPGIVRLVWSVKPHAVLSTLSHLNAFLILFRFLLPRSTRLLVRETTTASVMFLQQNPHNPRIWHWLYRRFYKNADRIVCLSDAMVSDLVSHFAIPQEKLIRIYNPVDIERIHALASVFDSPYRGAGPHLVAAGRLSEKRVSTFLWPRCPPFLLASRMHVSQFWERGLCSIN